MTNDRQRIGFQTAVGTYYPYFEEGRMMLWVQEIRDWTDFQNSLAPVVQELIDTWRTWGPSSPLDRDKTSKNLPVNTYNHVVFRSTGSETLLPLKEHWSPRLLQPAVDCLMDNLPNDRTITKVMISVFDDILEVVDTDIIYVKIILISESLK